MTFRHIKAIEFLQKFDVLKEYTICSKCNINMNLRFCGSYVDGYAFRCPTKVSKKKICIKQETKIVGLNIETKKILRGIYC